MSNYKRVLKHLNKEELSTQKIELALVDDFENQYNSANKLVTKAYGGSFKIESALKSMLKDYDAAGKSFLKANARYQELENAAEKLGIDLDAKYKNYKSDISKTLKEIDAASRKILQALKLDFV
jgi:DNA repair ATPase RecN